MQLDQSSIENINNLPARFGSIILRQSFIDKALRFSALICSYGFAIILFLGWLLLKTKSENSTSITEFDWEIYGIITFIIVTTGITSLILYFRINSYTIRSKEPLDCIRLILYGINNKRLDLINDNVAHLFALCDKGQSFSELTGKLFSIIIIIDFFKDYNIDLIKKNIDEITPRLIAFSQSSAMINYAIGRIKEIESQEMEI